MARNYIIYVVANGTANLLWRDEQQIWHTMYNIIHPLSKNIESTINNSENTAYTNMISDIQFQVPHKNRGKQFQL